LEYGGEEYIAGRIEDSLADRHEMFRYIGSSSALLRGSLYEQFMIPWRTLYNRKIEKDLLREQARNNEK
jgi:hypothetical protein